MRNEREPQKETPKEKRDAEQAKKLAKEQERKKAYLARENALVEASEARHVERAEKRAAENVEQSARDRARREAYAAREKKMAEAQQARKQKAGPG